jgi:hypothetical protein
MAFPLGVVLCSLAPNPLDSILISSFGGAPGGRGCSCF